MLKCAALAALVAPAMSASPGCAQEEFGYIDPNVPLLDGGLPLDAQGCQDLCKANPMCQVFTYYTQSRGCWLQGGDLTGQAIPGTVSGPKYCPDPTLPPKLEPLPPKQPVGKDTAAPVPAPVADAGDKLDYRKVIGLAALSVVMAGIAYVMCCQSEKAKKKPKTRGLDLKPKKEPEPALEVEAPLMMQQPPVPTVAAPMPMYSSYSVAPPVYTATVVAPPSPTAGYFPQAQYQQMQMAPQVTYAPQYAPQYPPQYTQYAPSSPGTQMQMQPMQGYPMAPAPASYALAPAP